MTRRGASEAWLVFAAVAAATVLIPVGFDEAAWSVLARDWFGGAELYVDAIDNKTPVLIGLIGFLDILPGPFPLARAVAVGGLGVAIWWSVQQLVGDGRSARLVGAVTVFGAVAGSTGLLTTEILAVSAAVLAMALAARAPYVALFLVAISPTLDPRMVVLLPGLAWWLMRRAEKPAVVPIVLVGLGIVGLGVVLVSPTLRFALIDLNVRGSRVEEIEIGRQVLALLRAVLPLAVALLFARVGRPTRETLALGVPALIVAWVSFRPFEHYWVLVIPAVVAWATTARWRPVAPVRLGAALTIACLPIVLQTVVSHQLTQDEFRGYEAIVPDVESALGASGSFVAFDNRPWLPYLIPDRNALRSPLLGYLITPSSRQAWALDDLEAVLASGEVAVIVEDGGLSVERAAVRTDVAPVRDVIERHLAEFPCRAESTTGPTLWTRSTDC